MNYLKEGTNLDHVRRGKGEPLVQTDILVHVRVKDLEELEGSVSNILDVVPKRRGDIT